MDKWTRIEDGYAYGERVRVFDNGGGLGPSQGSGRWALELDGAWIANLDTLAEAKQRGEAAVAQPTAKDIRNSLDAPTMWGEED